MPSATATTGLTNFSTAIRSGRHVLSADEPPERGGQDAGPTPTDLLLAALAACTGITLRMYAERKSWPVDAVHVVVNGTRSADQTLTVERILTFDAVLTEEQTNRLAEIAERTPVTLSLKSGIAIHTRIGSRQQMP